MWKLLAQNAKSNEKNNRVCHSTYSIIIYYKVSPYITILTILPGTTMTFFGAEPFSCLAVSS